jgi:hypothetical protein
MNAVITDDAAASDKLLSTISDHSAAVNCVRWSPCGYFAPLKKNKECSLHVSYIFGANNGHEATHNDGPNGE